MSNLEECLDKLVKLEVSVYKQARSMS